MGRLTYGLVVVNIVVFLLVFSMPQDLRDSVFQTSSFSTQTPLEVWLWFTALFLHASASHLFFNMLGLFIFGRVVEKETDRVWFMIIYFASGLIGNLAFLFANTGSAVGASGAIFGLIGAAMFLKPDNWVKFYLIPLPLSIVAVLFVITETFVLYFQPSGFSNFATVSHVAGIAIGSSLAFYYSPKKSLKNIPILIVSAVLVILLVPIFSFITGIGGLILEIIDFFVGLVLYSLSSLLSFIWL